MAYLFSSDGIRALKDTLKPGRRLLLALDFDGTLAPIVARPELARTPLGVSRTLAKIGKNIDIAVVSGRSVADVSPRLGFLPRFVIGNHGLEGIPDSVCQDSLDTMKRWSDRIDDKTRGDLQALGVKIEDKGHSLSFHYRLARDRSAAIVAIERSIAALVPKARRLAGKCVINALPPNSADKFQAIRELVKQARCDVVIFAGDDVTDEVVFEKAPPHWLTIRVDAAGQRRKARFHMAQTEMAMFLQRLAAEIRLREIVTSLR